VRLILLYSTILINLSAALGFGQPEPLSVHAVRKHLLIHCQHLRVHFIGDLPGSGRTGREGQFHPKSSKNPTSSAAGQCSTVPRVPAGPPVADHGR
jgi:hypothetical protein